MARVIFRHAAKGDVNLSPLLFGRARAIIDQINLKVLPDTL